MTSAFVPLVARAALRGIRTTAPLGKASATFLGRMPSAPVVSPPPQRACRMQSTTPDPTDAIMSSMEKKIKESLNPTRLQITPTIGDPNGAHVEIEVISEQFEGLNAVKRHQAVYKAIWEELAGPVHAVDRLVTKTPAEDSG